MSGDTGNAKAKRDKANGLPNPLSYLATNDTIRSRVLLPLAMICHAGHGPRVCQR